MKYKEPCALIKIKLRGLTYISAIQYRQTHVYIYLIAQKLKNFNKSLAKIRKEICFARNAASSNDKYVSLSRSVKKKYRSL